MYAAGDKTKKAAVTNTEPNNINECRWT